MTDIQLQAVIQEYGLDITKMGEDQLMIERAMSEYIDDAEDLSCKTCEDCGQPGKSRQGGWIKTLCDEHSNERSSLEEDDE